MHGRGVGGPIPVRICTFFTRTSHFFSKTFMSVSVIFTPALSVTGEVEMDLIYLVGVVAFWGLCVALVRGCDRLARRSSGGRA
jgi:hypothetical protein